MAAGSAFNIDTFTSKLTRGGALASLFECEILATGEGVKGDLDDFRFLCTGVSLPASTITAATVTYMGRALQIPGNRDAAQLVTNIYNDENMEIRAIIENWMEAINGHKTNKRKEGFHQIAGGDTSTYTGTLTVAQLSKVTGDATRTYKFHNAWPSGTTEVALSWETNDIEKYKILIFQIFRKSDFFLQKIRNFIFWRKKSDFRKIQNFNF